VKRRDFKGGRRQGGYQGGMLVPLMLFAVAAIGIAWVSMGMMTREQWPIRWLEIDGGFERVSAEQLRASLAPLVASSYFTVDLAAVRDAAYRQPWVAEVSVQKHWPDTVAVNVKEFEPVAHWSNGRLVSRQGVPFTVPGADEIQGLPWLESPDGGLEQVTGAWQQFNQLLLPLGLEVERLRLDARGAWYLTLSNGTQVDIGRGDALDRLQRLVRSWPELTRGRQNAPAGVDLRYTNGFAVRWPEYDEKNGKET
jgi:cell division protein FtsQ